jgi:hypothetical protein
MLGSLARRGDAVTQLHCASAQPLDFGGHASVMRPYLKHQRHICNQLSQKRRSAKKNFDNLANQNGLNIV